MGRLSNLDWQGRRTLAVFSLSLLLMILLYACGDGNSSSDISLDNSSSESVDTGSAVFKIVWRPTDTVKGSVEALAYEPLDCDSVGVATITCRVYDESNNLLTTSDDWPCSEHSGTIDRIPVGQNRKFIILGASENGDIVLQGQKMNIAIDQRPDNDVGTIEAHPFVPETIEATPHSAAQINLAWSPPNAVVSPARYNIYRDGVPVGTSTSTSFIDTGLTQDTEYCYTISAYDAFGNESGLSNRDCATTEMSDDTDPPTIPAGLRALASSSSQIDLSWTASSDNVGVAGYRIYRDGNQVGTSTSTSYNDTGLTQNTEYCYTVEAYDAAGNGSGQSSRDCEPTLESFDWYRDSDRDGYGNPSDIVSSEEQPEGYVSDNTDCNDDNISIHPGATEACNSTDDNCNGSVDEGIDPEPTTCGIGQCASSGELACIDGELVDSCQPDTPVEEICDGLDNDCDGTADEGIIPEPTTCGVGECASSGERACIDGQLVNSCQSGTPVDEVCDGLDNDCDGTADEGLTYDIDEDGYTSIGSCQGSQDDCDDNDGTINPGADELCDGYDNNCDGYLSTGEIDGDDDGYMICENDCDDDDPSINPDATEVCNEKDDNCNGSVDENLRCDYLLGINYSTQIATINPYSGNVISTHGTLPPFEYTGLSYFPERKRFYTLTRYPYNLYMIDPATLKDERIRTLTPDTDYFYRYEPSINTKIYNYMDMTYYPEFAGLVTLLGFSRNNRTYVYDMTHDNYFPVVGDWLCTGITFNETDGNLYGLCKVDMESNLFFVKLSYDDCYAQEFCRESFYVERLLDTGETNAWGLAKKPGTDVYFTQIHLYISDNFPSQYIEIELNSHYPISYLGEIKPEGYSSEAYIYKDSQIESVLE